MTLNVKYLKYEACGNVYIVVDRAELKGEDPSKFAQKICDSKRGVGSDGILLGEAAPEAHKLRIINPDGSESAMSGNGFRIFAQSLVDRGYKEFEKVFALETPQLKVWVSVHKDGSVSLRHEKVKLISENGPESLEIKVNGATQTLSMIRVDLGNPHCVILPRKIGENFESPWNAKELGPLIEKHPLFPNRTNVQFVRSWDGDSKMQIEIWERGAGYTLSSGSSASASAVALSSLGLLGSHIQVRMPGGELFVALELPNALTMRGLVQKIKAGSYEITKN